MTTGGGICFGGGEPLLWSDFIHDFCKMIPSTWKITIETSLHVEFDYWNCKMSKLGLFDNKSKKVRLTTIYSNITIFDNKHILLERDDKVGLYSIELRKVIIPVRYNRIVPFHDYMTSASIGNKDDYFDIKGI